MDTEKVTKLQEMGFSAEMAEDALKSSNNDLEKAISYLFGEPIEIKPLAEPTPPSEPRPLNYEDTVAILNVEDIPHFDKGKPPYYDNGTDRYYENGNDRYYENEPQYDGNEYMSGSNLPDNINAYNGSQRLFDTGSRPGYESRNGASEHQHIEHCDSLVDIFDQVASFTRNDLNPPTILPHNASYVENYLIPLLIIVSQVNQFKSLILSKTGFDYGFDENWFNNKSKLTVKLDEDEEKNSSLRFIIEIQRAVTFLSPLSNRLFTGSSNLLKNLPNDFKSELANNIEDADELFPKFYASLSKNYENAFGGEFGLEKLFKSHVESGVEEDMNDLFVLPVELESRGSDIYQSLNSMFWGDDESIGTIRFAEIAPILTIQLCGEEDRFHQESFILNEIFYPEIYSSKFSSAVIEMDRKRNEIIQLRSSISNKIMSLNSFEGKKIKKVLQNSIAHLKLSENTESVQDLTNLSQMMTRETEELTTKLSEINDEYASLDLSSHKAILNYIESDSKFETPTPYQLIGVVFSATEYFYKSKGNTPPDEDWVYFKALYGKDSKVYDYTMETMEFQSVKLVVGERTKDSSQNMFLFYAIQESLSQEEIEVSDQLKSFFVKDNEVLELSLTNVEENETPEDSDMAVDSSSDEEGPEVVEAMSEVRKINRVNTEVMGSAGQNMVNTTELGSSGQNTTDSKLLDI